MYAAIGRLDAFIYKKNAFTNSVDQDETPHDERLIRVCAICHDKHILGNGGQY